MGRPLHVPASAGPAMAAPRESGAAILDVPDARRAWKRRRAARVIFFSNVTNLTFSLDPAGHNGDNSDQDSVWAGETGGGKMGTIRFMNATVVPIYHTKKELTY